MNEIEVNLIRRYLHTTYLIKEAVTTIEGLKVSHITLSGMLIQGTKQMGGKLRDYLKVTEKELRALGIHVWIDDDGGEVVYVCTVKNGVKGRHGVKRGILREDMEATLTEIMEQSFNHEPQPYEVMVTAGNDSPRV